jgi:hypothetical protein
MVQAWVLHADTGGTMSDLTPPDEPVSVPSAPRPSELPPPPAQTSRAGRALLLAGIVVGILLVGGAAAAFFSLRGAPETILDKVPAGADVVVVAHLDPAASQKMNLFRMAEKFPALGSRQELTQKLDEMLDQVLVDSGLTHDDLSWIGGEAGVYVDLGSGDPSFAILLATDDNDAAEATLRQMQAASGGTYSTTQIGGFDVSSTETADQPTTAIVNGVVVLASDENTMRSVIDTVNGGPSIQDDATFQAIAGDLPEDNLGMAYVNMAQLNQLLASMPGATGLAADTQQLGAAQAVGMSLSATGEGLSLDVASRNDPTKLTQAEREVLAATEGPNPLLQLVPSDAYAVTAMQGATSQLETSVEQLSQLDPETAREIEKLHLLGPDGLLPHLTGDVAIQVGPGQGLLPVGGTVMVGVSDAGAVADWLDAHLPKLLASTDLRGLSWQTEDYDGTTISYSDPLSGGAPLAWGVTEDAWVLGLSPSSVEQAVDLASGSGSAIASDPSYQAAVAQLPGTESVVYIDVQGVLSTVQGFLPGEAYQQFLDEGGSNVEPITLVAAGSESDEQGSRSTLLVGIP